MNIISHTRSISEPSSSSNNNGMRMSSGRHHISPSLQIHIPTQSSPLTITTSSTTTTTNNISRKSTKKQDELRSSNLDRYSFKAQTHPTLSQLLIRLGHVIFEEWDQFCGCEALKKRNEKLNGSSSHPLLHSTTTPLNRAFQYEKIFSKLSIEQQIHLVTNFIVNYSCYDLNGSITTRTPTLLYKYVMDEEGENITRSCSPSSPTHNSNHASYFSNDTIESSSSNAKNQNHPFRGRGRTPLGRKIVQQVSVLSEIDFQYSEEHDRCDSLMALSFLLDVVLRECIEREISQTNCEKSIQTFVSLSEKSEHFGDDSPCRLNQDSNNGVAEENSLIEDETNHYYWREYTCDLLKQLVIGSPYESDEDDGNNEIEREMSYFSNDITVWETLISRIFKAFLDNNPNNRLSKIETSSEQCKRLKKHFKTTVKDVNEVLQHDMCKLAFVCQQSATLFQPDFRSTAEKYIDTLRKEGKTDLPLTLEMSGELPFITVCYWHSMMCRGTHAYLSPLERIKAFHRMTERAIFPIRHIASKNPSEPSLIRQSVQIFLDLFTK